MYIKLIIVKNKSRWNEHIKLVSSFGLMDQGSIYISFTLPKLPEYIFPQQLYFPRDSAESDIVAENILSGKDVTCIFIDNKLVWANGGLTFKDNSNRYKLINDFIKAYYELKEEIEEDKNEEEQK